MWGIPRSTVHAAAAREATEGPSRRRPGPEGPCSDNALVDLIRSLLASSPFHVEGYWKVWARLRHQGTRTSKERVRRLSPLAEHVDPRVRAQYIVEPGHHVARPLVGHHTVLDWVELSSPVWTAWWPTLFYTTSGDATIFLVDRYPGPYYCACTATARLSVMV